ncbi:MAG: hypothetical protein QW356_07580 [Candidatus Hadarchaeales archaeon]
MRILRLDVNGLLGLRGSIDFSDSPVLIYGENIAGKSLVVNLIRFLLVKPRTSKKKYREDLHLKKGELLLGPGIGSCDLYLSMGSKLYKISLAVTKGEKTNVKYSIFSTTKVGSGHLSDLDWSMTEAVGSGDELWDDLKRLGLFPDLLDALISPSNVKNFEDAISGELVSIPEMIREDLSKIHDGAENYLETLRGLDITLSAENDRILQAEAKFRNQFALHSKEVGIDSSVFDRGAKALEELRQEVSQKREEFSRLKTKLRSELESPELRAKIEAYQKVTEFLDIRKEVCEYLEDLTKTRERAEELASLRKFLANLKASRVEDIISAPIPLGKELRGDAAEIVEKVEEIVSLYTSAKKICDRYSTTIEDIDRLLSGYNQLLKSLKHPLEGVSGVEAVVFRAGEKTVVSIPVDQAEKNPEIFTELEPLPRVHTHAGQRGGSLGKIVERVETIASELRVARNYYGEAKRRLDEVKKRIEILDREEETATQKANRLRDKLMDIMSQLAEICGTLKVLGIQITVPKSLKDLPTFLENFDQVVKGVEEALGGKLSELGISPKAPITEVLAKLKEKSEEIERKERACANLEIWLDRNLDDIARLESRKQTIKLLGEASKVCQAVLDAICKGTDIGALVESISENISREVETSLRSILARSEVKFTHLGEGRFECTIEGEKITHPSGSERACISIGVMASLGKCFDIPVIFDEALDRIDANNVLPFLRYLTELSKSIQVCIVACRSFNIEKNPKLSDLLRRWKIYRLRARGTEKLIEPCALDSILEVPQ